MKLVSEMQEDERKWRDSQVIRTECAFCPWNWTGPAWEGRKRSVEHRAEKHPDRCPRSQAAIQAEVRREARATEVRNREARTLKAMDAGEPQQPPRPVVKARGSARRFTRESVLAAFRRFREEHGRWPTRADLRLCEYLPSHETIRQRIGNTKALYAALGRDEGEPFDPGRESLKPAPSEHERLQEVVSEVLVVSREDQAERERRLGRLLLDLVGAAMDCLGVESPDPKEA